MQVEVGLNIDREFAIRVSVLNLHFFLFLDHL